MAYFPQLIRRDNAAFHCFFCKVKDIITYFCIKSMSCLYSFLCRNSKPCMSIYGYISVFPTHQRNYQVLLRCNKRPDCLHFTLIHIKLRRLNLCYRNFYQLNRRIFLY